MIIYINVDKIYIYVKYLQYGFSCFNVDNFKFIHIKKTYT